VLHAGKSLDEASIYVDTREQSMAKLGKSTRSLGILIKKVATDDSTSKSMVQSFRVLETAVKEFVKAHA
jgi:hypothetical protein